MILSADIGGTNSRFRLYKVTNTSSTIKSSKIFSQLDDVPSTFILGKKYENKDYASFMHVLRQFLIDAGVNEQEPPVSACFAVAGPVKGNIVRFTNRDQWHIDGDEVSAELKIPIVRLVNDFLAVGYGLLTLDEEKECVVLQKAPKCLTAPIACIGAGTGLGECFLTPNDSGQYQCFPSEGGHAEFAPRNEVEIGLLNFLKEKFGQQHRISVERIISGPGLANVYEYLAHAFPRKVDSELHAVIMAAGELKGAVIATHPENEICRQTMSIFTTAYGAEAGVAGLKWLPYGGLYLTGGLTPKNIDLIRDLDGPFMHALLDKGRVSGMLKSVPIFAVMAEDLGERGAHFLATKLFYERMMMTSVDKNTKPEQSTTVVTPAIAVPNEKIECNSTDSTIWYTAIAAISFGFGLGLGLACAKHRNK